MRLFRRSSLPLLPGLALPVLATGLLTAATPEPPASVPLMTRLLELMAKEEEWRYEPPPDRVGRNDVLYDLVAVMQAELRTKEQIRERPGSAGTGTGAIAEAPVDWARREQGRISGLYAEGKYKEAILACDALLKVVERFSTHPEIAPIISAVSQTRAQAQDEYDRAQAQIEFDALALRVEGILWTDQGTRLVILEGEAKAEAENYLVVREPGGKAVVLSIDTNKVLFRFVSPSSRKRYEFPVYVRDVTKQKTVAKP